jgi:uncharacterized protein YbjT (DUF2867 family)
MGRKIPAARQNLEGNQIMTVVVTGATGNVGRPLVTELARAGAHVRAVSRHPDTTGFPPDVEVIASAATAVRGASAVFLNSRALGDDLASVVELARSAGVTRLVALSAINADEDFSRQPSRFRGDRNKEVEQYAVESGLEWVSLRPTLFATNFAGMWSAQIRAGDVVSGPYATASNAPIVERDIAAVAAKTFLTDAELVETIGAILGRPLRYHEVPVEAVRERFIGIGFSPEFADAYIALLEMTVDKPAEVTHEVEKILDRPAQSFAEWVNDHRDMFSG